MIKSLRLTSSSDASDMRDNVTALGQFRRGRCTELPVDRGRVPARTDVEVRTA